MQPPGRQLMVRHSACTGDAVVMVTLSLHILATRWTGISLQNRKSRSSFTLMHVWHVITFDWHVETSAWTFHLFIDNLVVTILNKLIRGKGLSAAAVPRWAGCVVSYMICKALEHTTAIINSAAVTTVNVSMSTKGTVNWVCVRLGNAYFDTQKSPRKQHWYICGVLVDLFYLADLKSLDWSALSNVCTHFGSNDYIRLVKISDEGANWNWHFTSIISCWYVISFCTCRWGKNITTKHWF